MSDMLSQAEIDALLSGTSIPTAQEDHGQEEELSSQEIDALGEIGNISMGTSATTLFTLLGHKVIITTPMVEVTTWENLSKKYTIPYVAVKVEYTHGLVGSNLLILKEDDVRVITDLMMGGKGDNSGADLTDLHYSAISEAMNQMVGSSATSMSSMFDQRIDISPPKAFSMSFNSDKPDEVFDSSQKLVKISFKMVVGELIDSEIMQILPISFAKSLVNSLLNADLDNVPPETPQAPKPVPQQEMQNVQPVQSTPQVHMEYAGPQEDNYGYDVSGYAGVNSRPEKRERNPVNVQPAHFQPFDDGKIVLEKKNISLIMDVPLQVTVELGRTQKLIKDILEFSQGSIIELDKLAGEPVDILVNGKPIAKGEVVVIDESFGVRITDIIHPSKRL